MAVAMVCLMAGVVAPHAVFARGNDSKRDAAESGKKTGLRISDDSKHDDDDSRRGGVPGFFYKGAVTAVSTTGFTMTDSAKMASVVDTTTAKLVRVPRATIALADIKVGDSVWITGTKTGTNISASVVYVMAATVKPAKAKGTVTAVSGSTVTVQTKQGTAVTVQTTADTQVQKADGTTGAVSDVQVGSKVKARGLWDSVTSVLSALKIRIR